MDIVIQSLSQKPIGVPEPAFRIRYHKIGKSREATSMKSKEGGVPGQIPTAALKPSYVIIRKEYAYLEPYIRATFFEGAKDVRVFVDRRIGDRRKASRKSADDSRTLPDRRHSTPMLDVVISLNATK